MKLRSWRVRSNERVTIDFRGSVPADYYDAKCPKHADGKQEVAPESEEKADGSAEQRTCKNDEKYFHECEWRNASDSV